MAGQQIELPLHSAYRKTPVYEVGSTVVFGLRTDVVLPHSSDTIFNVTSRYENRLDLISAETYGTPSLWHVVADVNNIQDPFAGLPAGTQIRLPMPQRLAAEGVLNA